LSLAKARTTALYLFYSIAYWIIYKTFKNSLGLV
jgi:hypothetical protein